MPANPAQHKLWCSAFQILADNTETQGTDPRELQPEGVGKTGQRREGCMVLVSNNAHRLPQPLSRRENLQHALGGYKLMRRGGLISSNAVHRNSSSKKQLLMSNLPRCWGLNTTIKHISKLGYLHSLRVPPLCNYDTQDPTASYLNSQSWKNTFLNLKLNLTFSATKMSTTLTFTYNEMDQ